MAVSSLCNPTLGSNALMAWRAISSARPGEPTSWHGQKKNMNPKADEFQIGATPSGKCSLNLSPYESIWSIWSTANFQYQVAWILLSETLVQAASIAWRAAASLSKAWMRSSGEREAIEAKRSWVVEAKGQKQTQKVPSNKWIVF